MYVQLSIDNGIGTGSLAGNRMSRERYAALKDMAREVIQQFASANGWVDTTVEEHEFHDEWRDFTSTKVSAYATEALIEHSDYDLRAAVATLAWQFSQESIHVVYQRHALATAEAGLVYGKDAPQARRRETYIEKQGGHNPWALDPDVSSAVARLRETLEKVIEDLAALKERQEQEEADEEKGEESTSIKVDSETARKARDIAMKALGHPDADEATLDIFGKVLSLPAELSDGFTIVRSTTD